MRYTTLPDWLNWIKFTHPTTMDLSLERVKTVGQRLNVLTPACPVITVGGTNGKGSTVAGLKAIYEANGYRVGSFTSPYLFRFEEQVCLLGQEATAEDFCLAYERIDQARGDITLTQFEWTALAAFILFTNASLDVWILEVGLGGRFDAVNALDADLAIVASIDLDHQEWLGDTREKIGYEKAGIFRANKPAICGDFNPPYSLIRVAKVLNAPFYCQGQAFGYEDKHATWHFWNKSIHHQSLPIPRIRLQNCATVLQAIELMKDRLPVTLKAIHQGLEKVRVMGRLQVVPNKVTTVFDVSHNPAAASCLAQWIKDHPIQGKTRAVFSMFADKDILSTLLVMKELTMEWYIGAIQNERAASLETLAYCFRKAEISLVNAFPTIQESYQRAVEDSAEGDRIIVFGSFKTVAACATLKALECDATS